MKTLILTFISFFMLLSCRNSDDSFTPKNITPTLIAQRNLFSEYSNTTTTSSNLIINNDPDWNSFISNMNNPNNLSMSFNETNIDFKMKCKREKVLEVVSLLVKNSCSAL